MRNEHESCAVIERALEVVNAEADASYISIDHNITRFANSQIHQNMSEESAWLTLRVIVGNAMGVATTTVFDDDEIARTAELAREAARHSNPILGFDSLYRDNEPVPQLDTFDERTAAISPLEKARALRAMFDRGVRANVTFAGAYATGAASVWCGNTHGVRRFARMTHADATVIAVGANASGYATARARRTSSVDVGLPKRRVVLIENGVIRTPVLDKSWADRLSLAPTANAWHLGSPDHGSAFHLVMSGGASSREQMIKSTKLGIWITRFNYVNGLLEPKSALMTGTTRDGTFLVRDGEVVARLPNLRWTQSMTEAFSNIEAISHERRSVGTWYNMFGGTLAPIVKIRGWNITGKQEMR